MKVKVPVYKCPCCNKTLKGESYNYGCPIRVCPNCRCTYFDTRYHEIAVEGIREEDLLTDENIKKNRKSGLLSILAGFGLLIAGVVVYLLGWISFWLFIFGALCIISGISSLINQTKGGVQKRAAKLEAERVQSMQRIQNPQYVAQLRAFGYNVPQSYYTNTPNVYPNNPQYTNPVNNGTQNNQNYYR